MSDFITENEDKENKAFDKYYNDVIIPLVEENNAIKDKYRGHFWTYLLSAIFLISINALVALYNTLMHKIPLSASMLFLFSFGAFMLVFIPVRNYYKKYQDNIFDVFIKFYGNWEHAKDSEVKLVHSPIIPEHDTVVATHSVKGILSGADIEIRDTEYFKLKHINKLKWNKRVSAGVVLYAELPCKFESQMLMFWKGGFYRKNKFPEMENVTKEIYVPAANYFNIFAQDVEYAKEFLVSAFFENLLNLKDTFGARTMYVEMQDNHIRIYFEGSNLYFDSNKFWSKKVDKNKFLQLNAEFESAFMFVETMNVLMKKR